MLFRTVITAALLSTAAVAQPSDDARRQAERDLFEKIVEIPTVEGQTAEFRKLTALLTAEEACDLIVSSLRETGRLSA